MLGSNDTNELIPAYHTGSLECPCVPSLRWNTRLLRRFWPEPDSIFGSLSMTVPIAVHFCWTYHSACPSDHIDARSRGDRLAASSSSDRWRRVVSAAFDPTVASRADADRLLRTEPQVRLTSSSLISNNHSNHLHLARVAATHPTRLLVRDSSPMTNDPFIATHLITRTSAMLFPFGNNLTPGFH